MSIVPQRAVLWIVFAILVASISSVVRADPSPLADPGVKKLEAEMARQLEGARGLSYKALKRRHAQHPLDRVGFDARQAEYYKEFVEAFGLNRRAEGTLSELGFVVVPSPGITEWTWGPEGEEKETLLPVGAADVLYRVFAADLPVFISADAILHAWHRTFEDLMMDLEQEVHYADMKEILDAAIAGLTPDTEAGRDALFYLSVARTLLDIDIKELTEAERDEEYETWDPDGVNLFEPPATVAAEVAEFVEYIERQRMREVVFMGHLLKIDFSQFIPRGYYSRSRRLTHYFRAVTWLGQTDLVLYDPVEHLISAPREEAAARAIARALAESDHADMYRELMAFYSAIIGRPNTLSPVSLIEACEKNGSPDCGTLTPGLEAAYAAATPPAYSSRVFENRRPPVTLRFFPKRFALDAWVLARTTTPKLEPAVIGGRAMAMDLDVAFALGSDRALDYYKKEMGRPFRQNLPAALEAARNTLMTLRPAAMETTVYNHWLEALMALSEPAVSEGFPEAMRTGAYHDRKLEAVLASWAELRHDTVLMVEQSVGGVGCQYPKGYVEPVPELYRSLGRAAALMASAFGPSEIAHYAYRLDPEKAAEWERPTFFEHWQETLETLAGMAEKELRGEAMSAAELEFLNRTVDLHRDPYDGTRLYNGWYPRLYWSGRIDSGESRPVVTDVHTDAERGRVLQAGVGHPGLMVIAVDNGKDLSLYGGPVYNYYSFKRPLGARMTDDAWRETLGQGDIPKKPGFTRSYWVPGNKTRLVPTKPDSRRLRF